MKVLVIGNGFDLAHGFETKYRDFLDFVKQFNLIYESKDHGDLMRLRNSRFQQFLSSLFSRRDEMSNKVIRELRQFTYKNIWIEHFQAVMDKKGQNWIDFEKEISDVVKAQELYFEALEKGENPADSGLSIVFKNDLSENINEQITSDKDLLKIFKRERIEEYLKHLNNLIRALEIYFTAYVMNSKHPDLIRDILDINLHKNDAIISFNYTDTYNKLYKQNLVSNVYFLHGKALLDNTVENNNMVLGIDEYNMDNEGKNSKLDYVAFKKYFQRIIKGTTPRYKEIFENCDPEETIEMYVYGHSLDVTDRDVFRELFSEDKKNVKITVFSYDKESQEKHVRNLVQILGMEKMIEYTYSLAPKITFREQS